MKNKLFATVTIISMLFFPIHINASEENCLPASIIGVFKDVEGSTRASYTYTRDCNGENWAYLNDGRTIKVKYNFKATISVDINTGIINQATFTGGYIDLGSGDLCEVTGMVSGYPKVTAYYALYKPIFKIYGWQGDVLGQGNGNEWRVNSPGSRALE